MENKFERDFTDLFRYKLYRATRVLVNNMEPVVTQVKLFVENILLSPDKGDGSYTYRISNAIDLIVNISDGKVEHEWVLCTEQTVDNTLIVIDMDNVNAMYNGNRKMINKLLAERSIEEYPDELFGKAFVCCIECIREVLNQEELIENIEIYDLFKLGNNGMNNVIL